LSRLLLDRLPVAARLGGFPLGALGAFPPVIRLPFSSGLSGRRLVLALFGRL
jgi:hypothetical protein